MKRFGLFMFVSCFCLCSIAQQTNSIKTDNLEYYIQNKKIGLRDKTTKTIVVPCKYDYLGGYGNTKISIFKRDNLYGYINDKNVEFIKAQYEEAYSFSSKEGLAGVKKAGKWGFINKAGIVKIPMVYDDARSFSEGIAIVKKGGLWGAINTLGKIVIPFKYTDFRNFSKEGTALVLLSEKWGMIDRKGKTIINCKYDDAFSFNEEGYALVKRDGKSGIIYKDGKETAECIYDGAGSLADGLLCVKQQDKYGFIDYWGKLVIPCRYGESRDFKNGITGESIDDICVIMAKDTRTIATLPGKYAHLTRVNYYSGNLFVHFKSTNDGFKKGLVDENGKYILPCTYDDVSIFHGDGLIAVKKSDKWGFSDIAGNLKISYQFDDTAYHFENGVIAVKKAGSWGMIDKSGATIVPFKYDDIKQNYNTYSKVQLNEKWGLVDKLGKIVLQCKYDEVGYPNTTLNYVTVKLHGTDGYVDFEGNDTF